MSNGLFISFEGVEGTGKSTQARMLAERLEGEGRSVVLTKEPGGTVIGQHIRGVLLNEDHGAMEPEAELLLYAADRRQHVWELIRPALEQGKVVITDRYADSTRAYQGVARGLDKRLVDMLEETATGGLKPDLTVLLDLDVSVGLRRNREEGKSDRLEQEDVAFHERVREGFLEIQKAEPERVRLVDATGSPEEVHSRVWDAVSAALNS